MGLDPCDGLNSIALPVRDNRVLVVVQNEDVKNKIVENLKAANYDAGAVNILISEGFIANPV